MLARNLRECEVGMRAGSRGKENTITQTLSTLAGECWSTCVEQVGHASQVVVLFSFAWNRIQHGLSLWFNGGEFRKQSVRPCLSVRWEGLFCLGCSHLCRLIGGSREPQALEEHRPVASPRNFVLVSTPHGERRRSEREQQAHLPFHFHKAM